MAIRYRVQSPEGEEHGTKVFLILENGEEIELPNVTEIKWGISVSEISYAVISVIGVKLG
jgi:hypothetical protein